MRFLLGAFKFLFGSIIVLGLGILVLMNSGLSAVGPGQSQQVKIQSGTTGGEIARQLERAHLIRNALVFQAIMRINGSQDKIKAGEYTVAPTDDALTILQHLVAGDRVIRTVTFTEGQTAQQMAATAESAGICKADEFLRLVNKPPPGLSQGLTKGSLEGFLFPETYEVDGTMTAQELITKLVDQFERRVLPLWQQHQGKVHVSLEGLVIMASMIEREAQVPEERPLIASVLYRRLEQGMPLQCDATVEYALGEHKPFLTYDDLEKESPYNTYKHKGLPPGPISNPGLACLEAAMNPATTEFLYYVRNDKKNDGSHVFSKTYEEHQQAIKQYQNP